MCFHGSQTTIIIAIKNFQRNKHQIIINKYSRNDLLYHISITFSFFTCRVKNNIAYFNASTADLILGIAFIIFEYDVAYESLIKFLAFSPKLMPGTVDTPAESKR